MRLVNSYLSFPALLYLNFFFCHALAATTPAPSSRGDHVLTNLSKATDGNAQFLNLTSFDTIDPDFVLIPKFKGRKLFPVSCLLAAVDAALQLALGDFEGTVPKKMVFKLDDYPQVEIVLLPYHEEGRSTLPWKYAVWALNHSITLMIRNGNYQSSVFFILQKDHGLGALSYSLTQPLQGLEDSNNKSVSSLDESSLSPDLNITAATDSSNYVASSPDLRIFFKLYGSKVALNDIFITSLDLLRAFAVFPRSARIDAGVTHVRTGNLYIKYYDPNNPPRTSLNPPYFKNEWLLRALSLTPGYMVKLQLFKEVVILASVDKVIIAEISLSRAAPDLAFAES